MRRFLTVLAASSLLTTCGWVQTSSSTTTSTSATTSTTNTTVQTNTDSNLDSSSAMVASNVTVNAELEKPLDAKKAKPGDPVMARSTMDALLDSGVKLPRGSKLIGHVTKAQAHSREQEQSMLGIIFDRAQVKGGQELRFHAFIQALTVPLPSRPESDNDEVDPGMGGMNRPTGGGGTMGGLPNVGGTVGGIGNTAGQTLGQTTNTVGQSTGSVSGRLTSNAQGAVNMPGLTMNTAAANTTDGSVITSNSRTVKLDSGTQMVLRLIAQ